MEVSNPLLGFRIQIFKWNPFGADFCRPSELILHSLILVMLLFHYSKHVESFNSLFKAFDDDDDDENH